MATNSVKLPPGFVLDEDQGNMNLPEGFVLDSQPAPTQSTTKADSSTSRFGEGLFKTTIGPIKDIYDHQQENVKKYGEIVGGFKTMYDLGKGLIKGSNDEAVKTLQALGNMDFGEAIQHLPGIIPGVGPAAVHAGEEMEKGNVAGGLGEATGLIGSAVIGSKGSQMYRSAKNAIKTGVAETVGKTTGAGSGAMKQAMTNTGADFKNAMRGNVSETELVGNFRKALQNVKDFRGEAYRQQLEKITSESGSKQLNIAPVKSELEFQLKKFNIVKGKKGELDFSRSTIRDASAQNEVKSIYKDVSGWGTKEGDLTPSGLDTLKRRVDDTYSPSSTARAIVQAVKNSTKKVLNEQVPGYQKMTQGYAEASKFLDALGDLSLEGKNPGTAVRKLTTLLNQNNGYRQMLAEKLSEYTLADLEGQLAGLNLNRWSPRGIMGPASGIGLVWGVASHALTPKTAVAFAMTSPRVMGELLNFIARTPKIPEIPNVALKWAAATNAALAGQQSQRTQNEPAP